MIMAVKQNYVRLLLVLLFTAILVLTVYWAKGSLLPAEATTQKAQAGIPVEIRLTEWEISPRNITVEKGETVQLTIVNQGAYPHDFVINGLNIKTGILAPGQKGTLTFVAEKPATLETVCSLPGHKESGMVAKLSVQ